MRYIGPPRITLDEDTLASDSDLALATQQSIKAYVDANKGSWTLIASATASASSVITFSNNIDSTYDTYVVVFNKVVPATDAQDLWMRVETGGSTIQSGAGDYSWAAHYFTTANSGSNSSADTEITFYTGGGWGGATDEHGNGFIFIHDPNDSGSDTYINATYALERSDSVLLEGRLAGRYEEVTAVTGVQFLFASGNIASGDFYLYGIAKA